LILSFFLKGAVSIFTAPLLHNGVAVFSKCARLYFSAIPAFYSNCDSIFVTGFLPASGYSKSVDQFVYVPNKNYYGGDTFAFTANIPYESVSKTIPLQIPTAVFYVCTFFSLFKYNNNFSSTLLM